MGKAKENRDPARAPKSGAPKWVLVTGAVFLGMATLFLMGLVLLEISGHGPPCSSAPLISAVIGIAFAMGTALLGSDAAIKGNVPWFGAASHPVVVSAGGGVAVFCVVMLTMYYAYIEPCQAKPPVPHIERVEAFADGASIRMLLNFEPMQPPGGSWHLVAEVSGDEDFGKLLDGERRLGDPSKGEALMRLTPGKPLPARVHVRLVFEDDLGRRAACSDSRSVIVQEESS